VPKHAWTSGVVRLQKNKAHGISGSEPEAFNSLMELMPAIETILIDQGIILHKSRKMKKYFSNL